jgi:glycosyltransferase involved in cell wall biosynthesis
MSRKLKVVVFGPPLSNSGGIGALFTYFREEMHQKVDLKFIDTRGKSRFAVLSIFNLGLALASASFLRLRRKIDVAHLNFGIRGSALRKLILNFWLKSILRIPTVLHLHASSFDAWIDNLSPGVKHVVVAQINKADRVIVLGRTWEVKLLEIGVRKEIIRVIVLGVPSLLKPVSHSLRRVEIVKMLFAGELTERKGFPSLIEAIARPELENFSLLAAGAGDVTKFKAKLIEAGAQERVQFLGYLPLQKIHEYLNAVDVLVLPSRAEGLPVSVMEAFSAQVAVVCTNVGALGEYLSNDENSLVLDNTQPDYMARQLIKLKDKNYRKKIAEGGRRTWKLNLNVTETSKQLVGLWVELTQRRPE